MPIKKILMKERLEGDVPGLTSAEIAAVLRRCGEDPIGDYPHKSSLNSVAHAVANATGQPDHWRAIRNAVWNARNDGRSPEFRNIREPYRGPRLGGIIKLVILAVVLFLGIKTGMIQHILGLFQQIAASMHQQNAKN